MYEFIDEFCTIDIKAAKGCYGVCKDLYGQLNDRNKIPNGFTEPIEDMKKLIDFLEITINSGIKEINIPYRHRISFLFVASTFDDRLLPIVEAYWVYLDKEGLC